MTEITFPKSEEQDIYELGFDKSLNRDLPTRPEDGGPTVYDILTDTGVEVTKKITTTGGITSKRVPDNDGSVITIDWGSGNVHSVTLAGNRTIRWANQADGQVLSLSLKQDGTGSRTISWPSTVLWAGGVTATLTATAGKTDSFVFLRNNTDNKELGAIIGNNY